jgi:hypothetical protein
MGIFMANLIIIDTLALLCYTGSIETQEKVRALMGGWR